MVQRTDIKTARPLLNVLSLCSHPLLEFASYQIFCAQYSHTLNDGRRLHKLDQQDCACHHPADAVARTLRLTLVGC
jgi:hypothetical protein